MHAGFQGQNIGRNTGRSGVQCLSMFSAPGRRSLYSSLDLMHSSSRAAGGAERNNAGRFGRKHWTKH